MVKRLPNWLKIGLQSQFGPNYVVEFEAFFRKNLTWPTRHPCLLIGIIHDASGDSCLLFRTLFVIGTRD